MFSFEKQNFQEGFGSASAQEVDALNKALSAGSGYTGAPTSLSGGGALQVESLEPSLKAVTFEMKVLKLWPLINKTQAYNTVEEYNRQLSYGEQSNGGFFDADSGAAPDAHDANYSRELEIVRYIGTTRVVSHPLTLVRSNHGPMVAQQIKNGNMWILEQVERQLFEANAFFENATGDFDGDSADLPTGGVKFNGLDKQIRSGDTDSTALYTGFDGYNDATDSSVIRNQDGAILDEEAIEDMGQTALDNFGVPTHLFMDNKVHSDTSRLFYPKERVNNMGVTEGSAGFILNKFVTSAGEVNLVGSRFLAPRRGVLAAAQTSAPSTPTVSGTSTAVDATSQFGVSADHPAGTYSYRVSALNNSGESLATSGNTQAITAGNRVTITIASGTTGATYYAVFRAPVGTTTGHEFIGYVADSTGNGGGATFTDAGNYTPGLSHAYMLQLDPENITWRQLAPLMKIDLATTGAAVRWMQLLYGTPIVFMPRKQVISDNIGRA